MNSYRYQRFGGIGGLQLSSYRTMCSALQEMRKLDETKNYSSLLSLIEEIQLMGNRMEAGLYQWHEIKDKRKEVKKLEKEVKKLEKKRIKKGGKPKEDKYRY